MNLFTPARPELLAPAGGPAALIAAVNNGADAVYLGLEQLNARQGAENFSLEALPEAVRFAHLKGVRVYLTVNVVIVSEEMDSALALVDEAWCAGVDAVIVQDLGLARVLRSELPAVRLHASTQIGAHNALTLAELERMGFSRVTLARETSIPEIAKLISSTTLEVEVFVHGAICVCYSGQCLMSSMVGGRSGNRGQCAQPCRLPYELLDDNSRRQPSFGKYLLSPKDMCGIDHIPDLLAAGVSALKIEGRMKAPEYVALVTGVYRAAIDRAIDDPESFKVTEAERSILAEAFNRGFSPAYLDGIRDNRMMSYHRPNNRGVLIGRVSRVDGAIAQVTLDTALDGADTIEFWTSRGRFAQKAGPIGLKGRSVSAAPAGATVTMRVEKAVSVGDRVFRIRNSSLEQAARRTFALSRDPVSLPLDVSVRAVTGSPLRISVCHGGVSAFAEGPEVEPARTKSISAEEIAEHVGRTGGTPFSVASLKTELSTGAGISYAVLHRVRREAIGALEAAMLSPWASRERAYPSAPALSRVAPPVDMPDIVVRTDQLAIARACLAAGAQRAILPVWALSGVENVPRGVAVELPRIAHERETFELLAAARATTRAVVGNLGLIAPVAKNGVTVEAHWGFNTTNPWSVAALAEAGASFAWLSPELSGKQVAKIAAHARIPVGVALYGRQEVMVTEHCVLMSAGECSQVCGSCLRRKGWYALRDAKGFAFPVMSDPAGRSHVFNSVPLDLARALPEIIASGVAALRLDFTVESLQEAQHITRLAREALLAAVSERSSDKRAVKTRLVSQSTSGQFFRGIRSSCASSKKGRC